MPFCELYEADVDINTKNSLDNSGSNETVQKVSFNSLALAELSKIVVNNFKNLNLC